MSTRDLLRYVAATAVGIVMWVSGSSPWTTIGPIVIVLAVLAGAWHRSLSRS